MSDIYLTCSIWRVPLLGNRHFIIKSKFGKFCFTLTPDLCSLSLPVCALLCSICTTHWVILSRWCLIHHLVLRLTQHFYQVELTFAATRSICLSSASMSGSRSSIRIPQFPRKIIFRDHYDDVTEKWLWKWQWSSHMDIFVEHWRSCNHDFSIGASEEQNGGVQLLLIEKELF